MAEEMKDAEDVVVAESHSCACKTHPFKDNCPNHQHLEVQETFVR